MTSMFSSTAHSPNPQYVQVISSSSSPLSLSRYFYIYQNSQVQMNKRISQKKINGEIILKQTLLMNKLATIDHETKHTDELGFLYQPVNEEQDALLTLISKSKDITRTHSKQIETMKKAQQRQSIKMKRQAQGTFMTGLGLASESQSRKEIHSSQAVEQMVDPDQMLKELVLKQKTSDLEQLRKMIRETSTNLQGCSRKLNKNKKSIMHIADRYSNELPYQTLNILNRYEQFDAGRLQEEDYYRHY